MSEKATVLFVHYNAQSSGSAKRRIEEIVRFAQTHFEPEYQLLFLLPEPGAVSELLAALGVEVRYQAFHDNNGLLQYLKTVLRFALFCKRERIRLIHILDHVYWKPAELLCAKLLGIPFISMVTFNRPADAKAGAIRWARYIVCNSKATAQDFIAEGLERKTRVIHNSIELSEYENLRDIRAELFQGAKQLIGFVGWLHPIKGIDVALKAFAIVSKQHPDARFVIVGPEKQAGYKSELQALVLSLGVESEVSFIDFRDDIPDVMNSLDLLLVPSREEPFGYVTIEGGASGTPLIASAVGGITETIRDGIDGLLVPADDPERLSEAITELLNNPQRSAMLTENFKQRIAQQFSNQQSISAWKKIYEEILS